MGQFDGRGLGGAEVAAPPIGVGADDADAFDDDEHVGIDIQNGVAASFGGGVPIGGRIALAPGRLSVRLVVEVYGHHRGVAGIALRHADPVGDPLRLGGRGRVPDFFLVVTVWIARMVVEDQFEPDVSCGRDHEVEHLHRRLALEIGVHGVGAVVGILAVRVHRLRGCVRAHDGVGPRQANRIESQVVDLLEHAAVVACPGSVWGFIRGFEAKPVHAREAHGLTQTVDQLAAFYVQKARQTRDIRTWCDRVRLGWTVDSNVRDRDVLDLRIARVRTDCHAVCSGIAHARGSTRAGCATGAGYARFTARASNPIASTTGSDTSDVTAASACTTRSARRAASRCALRARAFAGTRTGRTEDPRSEERRHGWTTVGGEAADWRLAASNPSVSLRTVDTA